jgi:hypothetical protein
MLFNTINTYNYTADTYGYTVVNNSDGTTSNIYSTNPIPISAAVSTTFVGDILISTSSKLQRATLIRNIADRQGNPIYTNAIWEVYQSQPILNAAGIAEGYRYKARLISGDV